MRNCTAFYYAFLLIVFCSLAQPVMAQTDYYTPAESRKEVRKSLKEAKKVDTEYNDSHLNIKKYQFKKGQAGRKQVKSNRFLNLMEGVGGKTLAFFRNIFSGLRAS